AARTHQIDADEIAVFGASGVRLCDVQFAAGLFLVDRDEASAAAREGAENSEHARLGVIDDLDDAPAIDRAFAVVFFELFDAQQRAVTDACRRTRLWPIR